MKHFLAFLVLAVLATSLTHARRKRAVGTMSLRATPRVAVLGVTDEMRLECRPAPTVKGVLMAVLIHLEKIDENGTTTLVASQRINTLELAENNRTKAEGHLQVDKNDKESFLTVHIDNPELSDEGIYQCRFAYIDINLTVHTLGSKVNITVSEMPLPHYVTSTDCDCDNIWKEIEDLKAALALRDDNSGSVVQHSYGKCHTSFSARFGKRNAQEIVATKTAIFDHVISNKGNNYDSSTGIFKAPCAGQYFISATLRSHQNGDSGSVEGVITVDNESRARTSVFIDAAIDNYQSATNGVVLSLKEGQQVKVVVETTSSGEFIGDEYSVFSGFYLFP